MAFGPSGAPMSLFPSFAPDPVMIRKKQELFPSKRGPQSLLHINPVEVVSLAQKIEINDGYGRFTHVVEKRRREPLFGSENSGQNPVPQLSMYSNTAQRSGQPAPTPLPLLDVDPTMPLPVRSKMQKSPVSLLEYDSARRQAAARRSPLDMNDFARTGGGSLMGVSQGAGPVPLLSARSDPLFAAPAMMAGLRSIERTELFPSRASAASRQSLFDVHPYERTGGIRARGGGAPISPGYGCYSYGSYNGHGGGIPQRSTRDGSRSSTRQSRKTGESKSKSENGEVKVVETQSVVDEESMVSDSTEKVEPEEADEKEAEPTEPEASVEVEKKAKAKGKKGKKMKKPSNDGDGRARKRD